MIITNLLSQASLKWVLLILHNKTTPQSLFSILDSTEMHWINYCLLHFCAAQQVLMYREGLIVWLSQAVLPPRLACFSQHLLQQLQYLQPYCFFFVAESPKADFRKEPVIIKHKRRDEDDSERTHQPSTKTKLQRRQRMRTLVWDPADDYER